MKILSGKEIRIKRIVHDLSLTQLAEKMNVSRTWMSLVENARESGQPLRMKATLFFLTIENPQIFASTNCQEGTMPN